MAAPSSRVGDWQCPNTACINHAQFPNFFVFGSKVNCPKCGTGKSAQRAGDWCCPNSACVNHQNTVYGSKSNCARCGAARPALNARGSSAPQESPLLVGAMQPPPPPGGPGVPPARAGDWHCPNQDCKNHTDNLVFGSKSQCSLCGAEKPENPVGPRATLPPPPNPMMAQPGVQRMSPQQMTQQMAAQQMAMKGLAMQGMPMHGMGMQQMAFVQAPMWGHASGGDLGASSTARAPIHGARPGDWHCPNPACKNHQENLVYASKNVCPVCNTAKDDTSFGARPDGFAAPRGGLPPPPPPGPRPGGKGQMGQIFPAPPAPPPGPGAAMGAPFGKGRTGHPGDWHCPNPACKNHTGDFVYASKSHCSLCGTPKPAPGAAALSLKPGDWQCPNETCKNHINGVYASKTSCSICGMPKPDDAARDRSRSPRHVGFFG